LSPKNLEIVLLDAKIVFATQPVLGQLWRSIGLLSQLKKCVKI